MYRFLVPSAVKIDNETYDIAVACLPAGFVQIPLDLVVGSYLVINELTPKNYFEAGTSPVLVSENKWLPAEEFFAEFDFVDGEEEGKFATVLRKK